jgi:hypothetical protein
MSISELDTRADEGGDDRGRAQGAGDQTRDPDPVGNRRIDTMGDQDLPESRRQVRQDEEDTECIVRQQADVP